MDHHQVNLKFCLSGEHTYNAWSSQTNPDYTWDNVILFDDPAKRDHVHIFEWFLGEEAHDIIGDTVRSLLYHIFSSVLWYSEVTSELTEMILTSYLCLKMSPAERDFALSMMLQASVDAAIPAVFRLLIAQGASLVDPAKTLVCCTNEGDGPMAQMLVDCGVFGVSLKRSGKSFTPDFARVFMDNGMDAQAEQYDFGPLHVAAAEGVVRMVKILVTHGFADVNAQDSRGVTPLRAALSKSRYELGFGDNIPTLIVPILLEDGAVVNRQDESGQTSLHYATRRDYFGVVSALLKKGADPNIQDLYLDTPLHMAARTSSQDGYGARLDALLSKGADPRIPNAGGETPLEILLGLDHGREYVERHPEYFGTLSKLSLRAS